MTDKEVTKPKRVYEPDSVVRTSIAKSIQFVLNNKSLNPTNHNYVGQMEEKHAKGKQLTTNEVAGLAKIERALHRVDKGTYTKAS